MHIGNNGTTMGSNKNDKYNAEQKSAQRVFRKFKKQQYSFLIIKLIM